MRPTGYPETIEDAEALVRDAATVKPTDERNGWPGAYVVALSMIATRDLDAARGARRKPRGSTSQAGIQQETAP